jgi:hypothetical protein
MTQFSESIIGRIKTEHIAPVPRWHFLLKSYVFWGLLILSIILGSLSFSVIAHLIGNGDLDVFDYMQGNIITSAVMMLPYFWLFSLAIFALVAYYNWKHTRLGYKFKRRWLFVSSIVLSITMGSIFYAFGMGNAIDAIMAKAMPFYDQSKHQARNELWLRPESGLIMGKVLNIDNINNKITIQDGQGVDWNIDEKAVPSAVVGVIKKGKIVKVIGKKNGDSAFVAKEIRSCMDCQDDEDAEIVLDDEELEIKKTIKDGNEKDEKDENEIEDGGFQEK